MIIMLNVGNTMQASNKVVYTGMKTSDGVLCT